MEYPKLYTVIKDFSLPFAALIWAVYDLELPWKDDTLEPLFDPGELDPPSELYEIHPEPIQVLREKVLNHRRYQDGKLGPGEAFRGYFLAKGECSIPQHLRGRERVEVRFIVEDTRRKQYRSGPMYLHLH